LEFPSIGGSPIVVIIVRDVKRTPLFRRKAVLSDVPAAMRSVAVYIHLSVVGQLKHVLEQLHDLQKCIR
jgi:hypothetical protein